MVNTGFGRESFAKHASTMIGRRQWTPDLDYSLETSLLYED
jgi:hypothetical protein